MVSFLAPLSVLLLLLISAFVLLLAEKRRASLIAIGLTGAVLIVCGYGFFIRSALFELERQYPPFAVQLLTPEQEQHLKYVVVLGNSHGSDPGIPISSQISGASLRRIVEGIRIHRMLPKSKLVISGGRNFDPVANAQVLGDLAIQLGVKPDRMIIEDRPRDTFEEAELLEPLLADHPFVLVTSAAHMPRALGLFRVAGLQPIPAPTDYIIMKTSGNVSRAYLPTCNNFYISQQFFYEWLGSIWSKVKGG
jgi:uncharacterized SAM-binding protein YcdF (DUF218 family)